MKPSHPTLEEMDKKMSEIKTLAAELRLMVRENRRRWERVQEEAAILAVQSELNKVTWEVR